MIRFRKLMTLVTVTALLLTLWVPAAVSAAPAAQQEELLYFGRSIIAQMDNSEALYFAYDRLVEGFANQQTAIDVTHDTYRLTADEAWTAYDLVLADHPEFFYAEKASLYSSGGTVLRFSVTYSEELLSYATLVTHRAKVLIEGLENKSDYEISLILHDRICDAVKYNLNSQHNQTVVSSLALGETVCAGYSRAYQMMLQMLGIPCFYVVGTADNGAGIGAHGWNLVQLDGEWYYTDVTWDDQNDNGGSVYYAYLNNTYEQFSRDHFADEYADYLPRSTATANNYFVKNGLVLTPGQSVNVKKAAAAIKNSSSAQFYFAGSDMNEGINMVYDVIDDILRELVGNHYFVSSLGMLGHEFLVYWECDLTHSFETTTIPSCGGSPGTITQHCTVCGYTQKQTISPVGHEMEWEWDETHHTYHCHHCGVTEVYGEHVYDNACDTNCNECGAFRAVGDHIYDNACDADCNECEAVREVADHVYDDEYDPDCNECGAIREVVSSTPGDLNRDGIVNNRDLALMQQYINKWNVTIDTAAADVNTDGTINNRDLALLQQYINKWDVTLG